MEEIIDLLKELLNQRLSRKVKESIEESINIINSDTEDKIGKVISIFDKISNDPNLESHIRTEIWNIISLLESALRNN